MDVLEGFGLSPLVQSDVLRTVWGSDASDVDPSPSDSLQKWLALLPDPISRQIDLAMGQERPFMPPDLTPEMMAVPNDTVPSMTHIEIIYRCIDFALKAENYSMAAALAYVVDRACYRFGRSATLLQIVDEISCINPDTPIAPQVILRQARVMKDSGDLHKALRILDTVISGERKWDYKSKEQYENTKAVCVQIKGQILHNLGLWKEAVQPLVESVVSFEMVNDDKGTSSSLALLSRCLKKLSIDDYTSLRMQFLNIFRTTHPCYEAYIKGLESVRLIESLGATVYLAHSQLLADESLLMYTIQQTEMPERQKLDQYQKIVEQMKDSLANHRTLHCLHSLEVFVAFIRSIFMISLTLGFSPVSQDVDLARFLEKLSLELYDFMCMEQSKGEKPSASLNQSWYSARLMNSALAVLGLPALEGSKNLPKPDTKWSEIDPKDQDPESGAKDVSREPESSLISHSSSDPISSESSPSSVPASHSELSSNNSVTAYKSLPRAATFPATSTGHDQGGKPVSPTQRNHRQRFIGLTMSKTDLLAATCPALSPNIARDRENTEISEREIDVESLVLSASSIASAPATENAQGKVPEVPGTPAAIKQAMSSPSESSSTVSKSASTTGSSSAASQSSGDGPSKRTSVSGTVSHSASTQSSETHKSIEGLMRNTFGSGTVSHTASTQASTDNFADVSSSDNSGTDLSSAGPSGQPQLPPHLLFPDGQKTGSETVSHSSKTEPSGTSESETSSKEEDVGELSPLVDVSSVCSLMSDLDLGESVETDDSSEFLAHFIPTHNKNVQRAELMIYNPVTGGWTSQTTLAYKGPPIRVETEGSNREAFHVCFLHQDEPLGRYVGKRYFDKKAPKVYMQDVVCQMLAGFYVTRFNQALIRCPFPIMQVQFLSAAHLQFLDRDGKVCDWINVEPFLHGSFLKLTNNLKYVSKEKDEEQGAEIATALSHFTYRETGGALMMVDLQGWMPADGKGVVYLTDPVFHTRDLRRFSSGDRHQEGMEAFWTYQHRQCNNICKYLGLDKYRPDHPSVNTA